MPSVGSRIPTWNPASPSGSIRPSPYVFHNSTSADTLNGAKPVTGKRMASTIEPTERAEDMKHGSAMSDDFRIPSPPARVGRVA